MKKFLAVLLAALLIAAAFAGCSAAKEPTASPDPSAPTDTETPSAEQTGAAKYTAGTYTATGKGNNGDITVAVTFTDDAIASVEITSHSETPGISDPALENIPAQIVELQSAEVDLVSGATNSSKGLISAVKSCIEQAGGDPNAAPLSSGQTETSVPENAECDIVVVGGGGAGMTAAITAAEGGSHVILVEKLGTLGSGDTIKISSYFRVAGSQVQKDLGIEDADEADDYYNKVLSETPNIDKDVLRILADEGGPTADWLVSLGLDFGKVTKSDTTRLTLSDGSAPGPKIVEALWGELDRLEVDYRLNTRAVEILMEDGAAVGVRVETTDGSYDIRAKAVILATGGYGNNQEMIETYIPEWAGSPSTGSPALTGDGQIMAEKVGAKLISMNVVKTNPVCLETEDGNFSLIGALPYSILVNHSGERFVNEDLSSTTVKAEAVVQQEGREAFILFDQQAVDSIANIRNYVGRGYFVQADSLEELASLIGVDAASLTATVQAYQESYDAGTPDEFGRALNYRLDQAPYYAARVTASIQNTGGGMAVDTYGRVLNTQDEIMPGLYAAGHGAAHCGEGNTLDAGMASLSIIFGKVVAQTAMADIG